MCKKKHDIQVQLLGNRSLKENNMGQTLSEPITTKETTSLRNASVSDRAIC